MRRITFDEAWIRNGRALSANKFPAPETSSSDEDVGIPVASDLPSSSKKHPFRSHLYHDPSTPPRGTPLRTASKRLAGHVASKSSLVSFADEHRAAVRELLTGLRLGSKADPASSSATTSAFAKSNRVICTPSGASRNRSTPSCSRWSAPPSSTSSDEDFDSDLDSYRPGNHGAADVWGPSTGSARPHPPPPAKAHSASAGLTPAAAAGGCQARDSDAAAPCTCSGCRSRAALRSAASSSSDALVPRVPRVPLARTRPNAPPPAAATTPISSNSSRLQSAPVLQQDNRLRTPPPLPSAGGSLAGRQRLPQLPQGRQNGGVIAATPQPTAAIARVPWHTYCTPRSPSPGKVGRSPPATGAAAAATTRQDSVGGAAAGGPSGGRTARSQGGLGAGGGISAGGSGADKDVSQGSVGPATRQGGSHNRTASPISKPVRWDDVRRGAGDGGRGVSGGSHLGAAVAALDPRGAVAAEDGDVLSDLEPGEERVLLQMLRRRLRRRSEGAALLSSLDGREGSEVPRRSKSGGGRYGGGSGGAVQWTSPSGRAAATPTAAATAGAGAAAPLRTRSAGSAAGGRPATSIATPPAPGTIAAAKQAAAEQRVAFEALRRAARRRARSAIRRAVDAELQGGTAAGAGGAAGGGGGRGPLRPASLAWLERVLGGLSPGRRVRSETSDDSETSCGSDRGRQRSTSYDGSTASTQSASCLSAASSSLPSSSSFGQRSSASAGSLGTAATIATTTTPSAATRGVSASSNGKSMLHGSSASAQQRMDPRADPRASRPSRRRTGRRITALSDSSEDEFVSFVKDSVGAACRRARCSSTSNNSSTRPLLTAVSWGDASSGAQRDGGGRAAGAFARAPYGGGSGGSKGFSPRRSPHKDLNGGMEEEGGTGRFGMQPLRRQQGVVSPGRGADSNRGSWGRAVAARGWYNDYGGGADRTGVCTKHSGGIYSSSIMRCTVTGSSGRDTKGSITAAGSGKGGWLLTEALWRPSADNGPAGSPLRKGPSGDDGEDTDVSLDDWDSVRSPSQRLPLSVVWGAKHSSGSGCYGSGVGVARGASPASTVGRASPTGGSPVSASRGAPPPPGSRSPPRGPAPSLQQQRSL